MILFLRVLFLVVLGTMLGVTGWASLHQPLGEFLRGGVIRDPWVIATLCDAYWGFIAFYVWAAWKEQSLAARVLWLVALLALGNIAIAAYMLDELFTVSAREPAGEALQKVFARRNPGGLILPGALVALSVAVYWFA
ncbi:MAG: DUF1475 family protein [Opitutae bacterium]|nr:DUF1475 family protein [Opitutae bacterium]